MRRIVLAAVGVSILIAYVSRSVKSSTQSHSQTNKGGTKAKKKTLTIDDLVKGSDPQIRRRNGKDKVDNKIRVRKGKDNNPFRDFDNMDVKVTSSGGSEADGNQYKTGYLKSGEKVTARQHSSDGRPTLEITRNGRKIREIRYGDR